VVTPFGITILAVQVKSRQQTLEVSAVPEVAAVRDPLVVKSASQLDGTESLAVIGHS
jgi:porphobilinogen deaminase